IFNPTSQGLRFDPDGAYVKRWVPELAALPASQVHAPAEAPPLLLASAGVTLGETYPFPIVDHAAQRVACLAMYQKVRGNAG
ncbi:MAG: deoxyribodipyrimidine photo-lyase, partial [Candidatus Eisenbacteria bacterium]|nr:deoxyribodipyrimidine photo-lyase [Candidatus Eisenbacteria bacterium]